MIVMSGEEFLSLSVGARNEILARLRSGATGVAGADDLGPEYEDVDLDEVVDLTFKQVQTWMEKASDKTKLGLRAIATHGPVIRAQLLIDAGIENLSHFQSRTTIRTRTVTGDPKAFMLGWDDWSEVEFGEGKYAVTPMTYQSLRRYFKLD